MSFWQSLLDFGHKYDPIGAASIDLAHNTSTRAVAESGRALSGLGISGGQHVTDMAKKDLNSEARWLGNTAAGVGAVFGGLNAYGALGGAGAAPAGASGLSADAAMAGYGSGLTGDTALGLTGSTGLTSGLDASTLANLGAYSGGVAGAAYDVPSLGGANAAPSYLAPGGQIQPVPEGLMGSSPTFGGLGMDYGAGGGVPGGGLPVAGGGAGYDVPTLDAASSAAGDSGGGYFDSAGKWIAGNKLQTALLAESFMNALTKPKLPSAAQSALDSSSAAVQQAQGVLTSGGTSSPMWANAKAGIDANIDQNLKDTIRQMEQAAQANGMGGANSGVVQQQIAALKAKAETQRQTLYNQTLQQIVGTAVSELSGGNATLTTIANMQMQQSAAARQAASQTAELALLLGKTGGP